MLSWAGRRERASAVDPNTNHHCFDPNFTPDEAGERKALRLLSFNIQVGIETRRFRHYVTNGWKHVLPHEKRLQNLCRIANVIRDYDLVALQEVDGGSIRSGYVNQVEFLAKLARFPFWYAQTNRDLGPIAQHGNGLLSRVSPNGLEDHKLPGAIPGRGAVIAKLPYAGDELVVVMLHLSLGERSRQQQLAYIAERIAHERQVVVMGDMNSPATSLLSDTPLKHLNLEPAEATEEMPTYPAWSPSQALDHVLVSPNLKIEKYEVLSNRISDHLPVAVEVAARTRPPIQ